MAKHKIVLSAVEVDEVLANYIRDKYDVNVDVDKITLAVHEDDDGVEYVEDYEFTLVDGEDDIDE